MGLLDTIMFWRKKQHENVIEHIEGFEVDGCFTLPGARLDSEAQTDESDDS